MLRFLAVLITCYQRLNVDFTVQGAVDRILELADGRTVCLHSRLELKSVDEPFDEVFWNRLALLMRNPPALPGEAACFHPLMAEDIARTFNDVAETDNHSYRTMVWWARRLIPSRRPEFREREFLERCAAHVDHVMAELERRLEGTFDTAPSFLPEELRSIGAPGGYLHGCSF